MTHLITLCAGFAAVAVGTVALACPNQIADHAAACSAWITGRTAVETTSIDADARRFDEIMSELTMLDDLPRLELESNAHMPHFSVDPDRKPSKRTDQVASTRKQSTSMLQIRRSVASQPDGIFARSRVGSRSGKAKSIFEQSRAYKRHGSVFDDIRTPSRYFR